MNLVIFQTDHVCAFNWKFGGKKGYLFHYEYKCSWHFIQLHCFIYKRNCHGKYQFKYVYSLGNISILVALIKSIEWVGEGAFINVCNMFALKGP